MQQADAQFSILAGAPILGGPSIDEFFNEKQEIMALMPAAPELGQIFRRRRWLGLRRQEVVACC